MHTFSGIGIKGSQPENSTTTRRIASSQRKMEPLIPEESMNSVLERNMQIFARGSGARLLASSYFLK